MIESPKLEQRLARVPIPGLKLALTVSVFFSIVGYKILVSVPAGLGSIDRGMLYFFGATSLSLGLLVLPFLVAQLLNPKKIICALPSAFPDLSKDPVLVEGCKLRCRMQVCLQANHDGMFLGPKPKSNSFELIQCIIIGTLVECAFALGLAFHLIVNQQNPNWGYLVFGAATVFNILFSYLMYLSQKSNTQWQPLLLIPNQGDLTLIEPVLQIGKGFDLIRACEYFFESPKERKETDIPRENLVAVQLCAWQTGGSSTTWAVQGLLVARNTSGEYQRFPIINNTDVKGAATAVEIVSKHLELPLVFHADLQAWQEETERAKSRPKLRCGVVS